MSDHTPGPWRHSASSGGWDCVRGAHNQIIAKLSENNPANATLIAAAPDMLAELKRLRDVVGDEDASCIEAVIAHAEGQP